MAENNKNEMYPLKIGKFKRFGDRYPYNYVNTDTLDLKACEVKSYKSYPKEDHWRTDYSWLLKCNWEHGSEHNREKLTEEEEFATESLLKHALDEKLNNYSTDDMVCPSTKFLNTEK
jgi:hypothetical protein